MFKNPEISGVNTKIIPVQIVVSNITTAAGVTEGSSISFHLIFNWLPSNLSGFDKVSSTLMRNKPDRREVAPAIINNAFMPK